MLKIFGKWWVNGHRLYDWIPHGPGQCRKAVALRSYCSPFACLLHITIFPSSHRFLRLPQSLCKSFTDGNPGFRDRITHPLRHVSLYRGTLRRHSPRSMGSSATSDACWGSGRASPVAPAELSTGLRAACCCVRAQGRRKVSSGGVRETPRNNSAVGS